MNDIPDELHGSIRLETLDGVKLVISQDNRFGTSAVLKLHPASRYTEQNVKISLSEAKKLVEEIISGKTESQLNEGWGDVDRAKHLCDFVGTTKEEVFG